jgi:hypothetical protein
MGVVMRKDDVCGTAVKKNNNGGWSFDGVVLWLGRRCDIIAEGFNRIDRIFILSRYIFFIRSPIANNSEVKHAWPRAISKWVTDWEVFPNV